MCKLHLDSLEKALKNSLNNFFKDEKSGLTFKLILSGFYSSHPTLTKVLSDYIKLPAYLISPTSSKEITNIKLFTYELDDQIKSSCITLYDKKLRTLAGLGEVCTEKKSRGNGPTVLDS